MARPKGGYTLADGTRVPGVTTIVGRFKDSGGLIWWAWNEGLEGRDYRETRDAAADAGTLAHELVERHLHGEEIEPLPEDAAQDAQRARVAYQAFLSWFAGSKVEIVATETSLVSEKYRFGGTPDAFAMVSGRGSLCDWKSGKSYPDHLIQLAAYQLLAEEHGWGPIERFDLVRFDKGTGAFHHSSFPADVLVPARELFLLLRRAYELDKEVKKLL